ncbi:Na+/H+ antiporter family protein [Alkalibacterium sp. MB6]|uniref:Na+/H+ antiporter family protein n=1 Tax=Alkalibacterium sp. MB6 TaxID=2081965 RepID=UPI00192A2006|nr:Na+/H+ antiporter NhaC family protein [Alkalibacterium sp. MB6]
MLTNPALLSVIVMIGLSLLKLNVLLALIIAALVGGLAANMSLTETMTILLGGMGNNAETALNYVLLGALAAGIQKSGAAKVLTQKLSKSIDGTGKVLVFIIALISTFSQNAIPVHIAFIPILIPPLIGIFNRLKLDRRAVATALTFGLKAPYVSIPIGYGLIFHNLIRDEMASNGLQIGVNDIWQVMWIPGLAMVVGLLIAVFITYRQPREYSTLDNVQSLEKQADETDVYFNKTHFVAILGALSALVVQLTLGSLILGAILGLFIMLIGGAIKWSSMDEMINSGIGMMGFIAFVMLVASGYADVIRATGGVETLVDSVIAIIGGNQFIAAVGMIFLGLLITMGIGTSFGTIPVITAIYVPLAMQLGFSQLAIVLIIGCAAALGDAGSPASDSTLGPTAGLNVDGQHDHIWDTCVPTFMHFNIPIMIFGVIGAMIL